VDTAGVGTAVGEPGTRGVAPRSLAARGVDATGFGVMRPGAVDTVGLDVVGLDAVGFAGTRVNAADFGAASTAGVIWRTPGVARRDRAVRARAAGSTRPSAGLMVAVPARSGRVDGGRVAGALAGIPGIHGGVMA
jgi:hypothetical protein